MIVRLLLAKPSPCPPLFPNSLTRLPRTPEFPQFPHAYCTHAHLSTHTHACTWLLAFPVLLSIRPSVSKAIIVSPNVCTILKTYFMTAVLGVLSSSKG